MPCGLKWSASAGTGSGTIYSMVMLLGGGGDADAERPVLDRFVSLTGQGSVVYVPVALGLDDYAPATDYATTALGRPVETWTDLRVRSSEEIDAQAGIFIGGGNTYSLLNEIRASQLVAALARAADCRVLYGGSAGAVILGADIGTASFFDPNDVGLDDTAGLALLGAHAVWCHFVEDHLEPLRLWIETSSMPVLALTERSGAEVDRGVVTSIGHEPLTLITPDGGRTEVPPGQSISL